MQKPLTPERIMQMVWGYAPTLIIQAAIQHRVFDLLDESPKTIKELAEEIRRVGARPDGDCRMHSWDSIFCRARVRRYKLTPESAAFLVSTKPGLPGCFVQPHVAAKSCPRGCIFPKWCVPESRLIS